MKEELTLEKAKAKFENSGEKVRRIFDVMIEGKLYPVYSIPGYEHQLGKSNGCPDNWWLDWSDYHETIDEDGEKNEPNIRELIPYIDRGTHRICWEIRYRQFNRMKYKWDEWDIRNGGVCEMYANGRLVYKFRAREIGYALSRAQSLEAILLEHPFNFLNPQEEKDRKIWYYGLPATIRLGCEPGEIGIVPDYSYMSQKEWWDKLEEKKRKITPKDHKETEDDALDREYFDEDRRFESWINHGDALWDGMIWWFRD
jgi:hypothetical protein